MEAGKRSISDILNGARVLEIPFFQRSYVWEDQQWDRFISDMESISASNKPYFLGSIILKLQDTKASHGIGDKRTVIDGQQRLTTLSLLLKVISLKTSDNDPADIFRLRIKTKELALLHNRNDIEVFTKIQNLNVTDKLTDQNNVAKAFNYFLDNVDISKIDYQKILNNVMFVGVDLGPEEDEQQIFDTINSLGVTLTTSELLKNYFFSRNDVQEYIKYWQDVFEKDNECRKFWDTEITTGRYPRSLQDIFFYAFLQIKIQEPQLAVKTEDKVNYGKVEGLFESYKDLIKKYNLSKKDLIKEIKEYAIIFMDNFNPDVVDEELPKDFGIERINALIFGLENATLIPYILFILKHVNDDQEQNLIFEYLESYIMRRMICHANTKNYNQLFSERLINNAIISYGQLKDYISKKSDKVNYMPSNNEVVNGFNESKLINKQSLGVLYFIETKIRNRQFHSTALHGINGYSLEHIMPKKWENHWQHPSTDSEVIERNRLLLTLGNLTLITSSLNSSIRDNVWEVKLAGNGKHSGYNTYAAEIDTFNQYLSSPKWDEKKIKERASFLASHAISIWK